MDNKVKGFINEQKEIRDFNVKVYIKKKVNLINSFFRHSNLDAAVLGMSGGIDSAVTMALLKKAKDETDSPIKLIRGIIAPIMGDGVTGQNEAAQKAIKVCNHFECNHRYTDLTNAYNAMTEERFPSFGKDLNAWADGQMASVLRTPMFYYQAAMLQAAGYKSLVVGTTNRDEGSYIGFFGKASDAMVDLQIISDIHKSEVYQVAKELGVPEEIINATPKGDVWDNRVDEEMIGAPYHFLEDYLMLLEYFEREHFNKHFILPKMEHLFTDEEKEWMKNIEEIHSTNSHKYKVGMPSHFLDVMRRKIPGGWS